MRFFPVRFFPVRLFPVRFFPVRFFPRTVLYNTWGCISKDSWIFNKIVFYLLELRDFVLPSDIYNKH